MILFNNQSKLTAYKLIFGTANSFQMIPLIHKHCKIFYINKIFIDKKELQYEIKKERQ